MELFKEHWINQPNIFIGVGVAIAILLRIYFFLINKYKLYKFFIENIAFYYRSNINHQAAFPSSTSNLYLSIFS